MTADADPPIIVIEGVSAELPCHSHSLHNPDHVRQTPLDRWDPDQIPAAVVAGRFGGFVASWAEFDCLAFGLSVSEAAVMDPQQRALLKVCY